MISGLRFFDRPKIGPATVILSSSHGLKSHLMVEIFVVSTYGVSSIFLYSQTPKMHQIGNGSLPSLFAQFVFDENWRVSVDA